MTINYNNNNNYTIKIVKSINNIFYLLNIILYYIKLFNIIYYILYIFII
jgi:hypothetical protein